MIQLGVKISVVIPAYNEAEYLRPCLESLMNQTEKPHEIIVVDNNSTDKTVEIARSFKGVRVIYEKEQGIIPARNAGFNAVTGDIIARTDADCTVPPYWIKRIGYNFKRKNIVALTGPLLYDPPIFPNVRVWISWFRVISKMAGCQLLIGPNMAIRTTFWKKVWKGLCIDDRLVHEDFDLAIHIQYAKGVTHLDTQLIVNTSGRRIKDNPLSLFIDYPKRYIEMTFDHQKKKYMSKYYVVAKRLKLYE